MEETEEEKGNRITEAAIRALRGCWLTARVSSQPALPGFPGDGPALLPRGEAKRQEPQGF